jgi:hypothetical protein
MGRLADEAAVAAVDAVNAALSAHNAVAAGLAEEFGQEAEQELVRARMALDAVIDAMEAPATLHTPEVRRWSGEITEALAELSRHLGGAGPPLEMAASLSDSVQQAG